MAHQITRNIIVKSDLNRAFTAWANFENFPMFMKHVRQVQSFGNGKSHWEVAGPLGKTVEWDAEITKLENNKRIAWSTKDRAGDLTTSGQVTFNELPQGQTEVTVMMQYEPRMGVVGDIVAEVLGNPEKKLEEDLSNFKSYIEGHIDRTAA
jgi:uncharacterized membrane protein